MHFIWAIILYIFIYIYNTEKGKYWTVYQFIIHDDLVIQVYNGLIHSIKFKCVKWCISAPNRLMVCISSWWFIKVMYQINVCCVMPYNVFILSGMLWIVMYYVHVLVNEQIACVMVLHISGISNHLFATDI